MFLPAANSRKQVCDDALGLICFWRWYEGTALGMVHTELGKQARDVNPGRSKDALERTDTSSSEFSNTLDAALRFRRTLRRADFGARSICLGGSRFGLYNLS